MSPWPAWSTELVPRQSKLHEETLYINGGGGCCRGSGVGGGGGGGGDGDADVSYDYGSGDQ